MKKWFAPKLVQNVIALYGVQGCTYMLPLLTLPYLARTLGPSHWGSVLFAQSLGAIIALVVEYGFDFAATRETARYADDKARLRDLLAGVLGAKLVLAFGCVLVALATRPFTTHVAPSRALFVGSILWGVGQGIHLLWYFQGQQRMRFAAAVEVTGKVCGALMIFLLVRHPDDGWKVLAAQAGGCVAAHTITLFVAFREVGFRFPTPKLIREALQIGWPLFLFRASQTIFSSANSLILGLVASPAAVGLYAAADKINFAASQMLWPITQALFPHQTQQVSIDPVAARRTVRRSLWLIGGLGVCMALALILAGPMLIHIALGPAYRDAAPVLQVLGLVTPLLALVSVVGFQWMLPLGLDKQFNTIIFLGGLVHVLCASIFASVHGPLGIAAAVVCSQSFTLASFEVVLRRSRLSPIATDENSFAFQARILRAQGSSIG